MALFSGLKCTRRRHSGSLSTYPTRKFLWMLRPFSKSQRYSQRTQRWVLAELGLLTPSQNVLIPTMTRQVSLSSKTKMYLVDTRASFRLTCMSHCLVTKANENASHVLIIAKRSTGKRIAGMDFNYLTTLISFTGKVGFISEIVFYFLIILQILQRPSCCVHSQDQNC